MRAAIAFVLAFCCLIYGVIQFAEGRAEDAVELILIGAGLARYSWGRATQ